MFGFHRTTTITWVQMRQQLAPVQRVQRQERMLQQLVQLLGQLLGQQLELLFCRKRTKRRQQR